MIPDVLELTRRLIDIPSISGEEKAVVDFLANLLADSGFAIQLQDAAPGRP